MVTNQDTISATTSTSIISPSDITGITIPSMHIDMAIVMEGIITISPDVIADLGINQIY